MKVSLTSYALAGRESHSSGDACAARLGNETVIAALADGAGAARAGSEAAARIVEALLSHFAIRPEGWSAPKALAELTRIINHRLYQESLARFDGPELVSTLAAAVIEGNRLYGLNVGDSRVYLARQGRLTQLSTDHISGEYSHVLSRAIGLADEVEPCTFECDLCDGDIALLCSDGVSNVLDAPALAERLTRGLAARALVQAARESAKDDQIDDMSAVVVQVAELGQLKREIALPLEIPGALKRGQSIDGYELLRSFQQSDRVWLAARDGQRWTLKFPPVEASESEQVLTQFIKETWHATRVRGASFVPAFAPPGATRRYYVMEFVEAPSLKLFLRSRILAADEAMALGKALLEAAGELLRQDLIHGDLKPDNILAINDYDRLRFKIIDFGSIAEVFSVSSRAGTASYLAPERFHGAPTSERTEIFSIGVTLYEALTRALPFGEIERFQTPHFSEPKRPAALNRNIPPWLENVILRAAALDPLRRYQHYSEMLFDLNHPEGVEPFSRAGASLLERDPLRFYRTGFWLMAAVALLLALHLLASIHR